MRRWKNCINDDGSADVANHSRHYVVYATFVLRGTATLIASALNCAPSKKLKSNRAVTRVQRQRLITLWHQNNEQRGVASHYIRSVTKLRER